MTEYTLANTVSRENLLLAGRVVGCSLLVALCAQVALPLPWTPVPVTLQVFGVLLAAVLLRPLAAASALMLYLLYGAAGLPVFAPTGPGGMVALSGPTGGYLLSYPLAAAVTSFLFERLRRLGHLAAVTAGGLAGIGLIYLFGALWLWQYTGFGPSAVLAAAVYPFIVVDLLKVAAAAAISRPLVGSR